VRVYIIVSNDIMDIMHRIQLSIMLGEFDNLKGEGKPLDLHRNPFVDPHTEATYKVCAAHLAQHTLRSTPCAAHTGV
jgi:hypothetical protein